MTQQPPLEAAWEDARMFVTAALTGSELPDEMVPVGTVDHLHAMLDVTAGALVAFVQNLAAERDEDPLAVWQEFVSRAELDPL